MEIEEYLSELNAVGKAVNKKIQLQYNTDLAVTLGVDEEIFQRILELIPIAKKVLSEEELKWGQLNCQRIKLIRQADITDDDKVIMGAIYYVATSLDEESRFLCYFEPYRENHPIFNGTHLFDKKRDRELISLDGCNIINNHLFFEGHYFRLKYYNEAMVKYLEEIKNEYKVFVRVDPYIILDEQPLKALFEAVIRPINPYWIQNLAIYPGKMTAGEYVLQEPLADTAADGKLSLNDQLAYWEYHINHIRKLDVYVARENNKNLHMMIEELKEDPKYGKYFIGKCIHLDTDDVVGTQFNDSVLNHLDLAINVYDKEAFALRMQKNLSHGEKVKAKFRTHIMRVEQVPFLHLPQIAADFLDSRILYVEWMNNMFGGKSMGLPLVNM